MLLYDLYERTSNGKIKIKRNRQLPPRPTENMLRAVCKSRTDVLIAMPGRVWKDARLVQEDDQ